VPPPPAPRTVTDARSCDAGETIEAALDLYDFDSIDRSAFWSQWPAPDDLQQHVLAEADRQRAAIAALRLAPRCEARSLTGNTQGPDFWLVGELALAEARLRGDPDAAMDVAEAAFEQAEIGGAFDALMALDVAERAFDVLEQVADGRPDLARRAQDLGRRRFDRDALRARDGALEHATVGTLTWIWRGQHLPAHVLDQVERDWTAANEQARTTAAALY
jgi:hypothetical protein